VDEMGIRGYLGGVERFGSYIGVLGLVFIYNIKNVFADKRVLQIVL
jgi:hypothetical protein